MKRRSFLTAAAAVAAAATLPSVRSNVVPPDDLLTQRWVRDHWVDVLFEDLEVDDVMRQLKHDRTPAHPGCATERWRVMGLPHPVGATMGVMTVPV